MYYCATTQEIYFYFHSKRINKKYLNYIEKSNFPYVIWFIDMRSDIMCCVKVPFCISWYIVYCTTEVPCMLSREECVTCKKF